MTESGQEKHTILCFRGYKMNFKSRMLKNQLGKMMNKEDVVIKKLHFTTEKNGVMENHFYESIGGELLTIKGQKIIRINL